MDWELLRVANWTDQYHPKNLTVKDIFDNVFVDHGRLHRVFPPAVRRTDGGRHSAWQKRGMDGDPSGDDDGRNGGARSIIIAHQSSMVSCETFCSTLDIC